MLKLMIIAGVLALAGCTDVSRAFVNQAVDDLKQVEDTKANLAIQAPCAVTVGAFNRLNDDTKQRAVMSLCGGDVDRPATVEDLRDIMGAR